MIYRRVDEVNDTVSMVTVNSTSLNTELTGLGKYKLYSIQVAGRTVVGIGNFSDLVFVRTEQDGTFCLVSCVSRRRCGSLLRLNDTPVQIVAGL